MVKARVKTHLEIKHQRDLLYNLSIIDSMTGIFNRRYFDMMIPQELGRACRQKNSVSLLMIDLDYFKLFNDNYGHLAGDNCLKQVAQEMNAKVNRPGDFICRYGGEEFVCVLPDTDYVGAKALATQICKCVADLQIPHEYSQAADVVTVSIGVSSADGSVHVEFKDLVDAADKALYDAKRTGRNKVASKELMV